MSTLLDKSYLVKVSTKGEGGQKCPKFCRLGLYTAPKQLSKICSIFQIYKNGLDFNVYIFLCIVKKPE